MLLYFRKVVNTLEKMLKVKEVSQILGLAEITIRQWIQNGKIKSKKIGRARRIPESEVLKILEGEK